MRLAFGIKTLSLTQYLEQISFAERKTTSLLSSFIQLALWLEKKHLSGHVWDFSESLAFGKVHTFKVSHTAVKRPETNFTALEKALNSGFEVIDKNEEQSFAKQVKDQLFNSKLKVSNAYKAPEFSIKHHDARADVFVFGLLLASLFSDFDIEQFEDFEALVSPNDTFHSFKWKDVRLSHLATKCLKIDPAERPTLTEVIYSLNQIHGDFKTDLNEGGETAYHKTLKEFKASLLDYSKRNVLFHFNESSQFISIEKPLESFKNGCEFTFDKDQNDRTLLRRFDKIRLKRSAFIKETGEDTLYVVSHFLKWHIENEVYYSPLLLHKVDLVCKKEFTTSYTIAFDGDEVLVNEVLRTYFKDHFSIELTSSIPRKESYIKAFINEMLDTMETKGAQDFNIENSLFLGNFSYQNISIASDYEQLLHEQPSDVVNSLLGFAHVPNRINEQAFVRYDKHWVLPADPTQEAALHQAENQSIVIEGPPGTGKSQTIANLIAQALGMGEKVLFVSEKRAALDVVYKRLEQAELDHLGLLVHDAKKEKKQIIQSIAKSKERLSEPLMRDAALGKNLKSWKLEEDFDTLDKYYQTVRNKDYGFSLNELFLKEGKLEADISENLIPDLSDLLKAKTELQEIFKLLNSEDYASWNQSPLSNLDAHFYAIDVEPIHAFLKAISICKSSVLRLKPLYKKNEVSQLTIGDMLQIRSLSRSLKWLLERNFLKLVLDDNPLKSQYDKLRDQFLAKESLLQKRRKKSAISESADLTLRALESALATFQKAGKTSELEAFMTAHFILDDEWFSSDTENILKNAIYEFKNEEQLIEIRSKFQSQFKTQHPEDFIEQVSLLQDISQRTAYQLPEFFEYLNAKRFPDAVLLDFLKLDDELSQFEEQAYKLHVGFRILSLTEFENYMQELSNFKLSEAHVLALKTFNTLKENIKYCLKNGAYNLSEFEQASVNREIRRAFLANPDLEKFNSKKLNVLNTEIDATYTDWLQWNSWKVFDTHITTLAEKQNLSETPAQKLSAEQKTAKWSFKRGLRLLQHEIDKEKRHKSLRELLQSDAKSVVDIIKPVFLMSPKAVAEIVPCQKESFDLVIFDEASQIRLEEVLPICHRAKRIVVVGDSEQLPPSNFFRSKKTTANTADDLAFDSFLLAAKTAFRTVSLNWHYRSQSAALINFSNSAFYNFKLQVFPSYNLEHKPLEIIRVENAIFKNRQNELEAKELVAHLAESLKSSQELSYAVIAMSEAQQDAIEQEIELLRQADLAFDRLLLKEEDRYENGAFAGLLVKNLENMQGEERDVVFISIGYGFDENGKFRQHFGPIMQDGGDRRLNVLLSRAKVKMKIFCSFAESDIKTDINLGAWTLKMFLRYAKAIGEGDEHSAQNILIKMNGAAPMKDVDIATNAVLGQYEQKLEKSFPKEHNLKALQFSQQSEEYIYQLEENGKPSPIIYEFEPTDINTWKEFFISKRVLANRGFKVQKLSSQDLAGND